MNHSWRNNSAPGFVYFQNDADTPDFLSFSDSSSQENTKQHFSPSNYSSPKYKGSPRKFNSRNNYRHSSGNFSDRHSSNYESNYRPNHSFRRKENNRGRGFHHTSFSRDINQYIDRDCLRDPWEELERLSQSRSDKIQEPTSKEEENDNEVKKQSSEDCSSDEDGSSSEQDAT